MLVTKLRVASVATKPDKGGYLANYHGEEKGDYVEFSNGRRGSEYDGLQEKGAGHTGVNNFLYGRSLTKQGIVSRQ